MTEQDTFTIVQAVCIGQRETTDHKLRWFFRLLVSEEGVQHMEDREFGLNVTGQFVVGWVYELRSASPGKYYVNGNNGPRRICEWEDSDMTNEWVAEHEAIVAHFNMKKETASHARIAKDLNLAHFGQLTVNQLTEQYAKLRTRQQRSAFLARVMQEVTSW